MRASAKVATTTTTETAEDTVATPPETGAGAAEFEQDVSGVAQAELEQDSDAPPKAKPPRRSLERGDKTSQPIREIREQEDQNLRDWLSTIGTQGAFKVQVVRESPEYVIFRGKQLNTKGHLKTFDGPIDEEMLQRMYGGGKYSLKVTRRGDDGTYRFQRGFHRTLEIAGEPSTDNLPGGVSAEAAAAAPAHESPSIARDAFQVLKDELSHARKDSRGVDPMFAAILENMQKQMEVRDRQIAEMQRELLAARTAAPPANPLQDKMLSSLLDNDQARVVSMRTQHESEIRMLKESHQADLKRIEDRHDRTIASLEAARDRQLSDLKHSYEREIVALRSSHEVALAAVKQTGDTQAITYRSDIARLERENAELREQNRELREKKEKGVVEQIKEMQVLKEALGVEDGEGSKPSVVEQVAMAASSPPVVDAIQRIFARGEAQPQAAAPIAAGVQPQVQAVATPRVVRGANGKLFLQTPQGLFPAKRKPKLVTTVSGEQIEAPQVDEGQLKMLVAYMERAYTNNQDPAVVAQSGRSQIPEDVLNWIRSNDTDAASGVDLFMTKVAKLPSTSPLATQGGRNWLRKVGRALLGSESES